MATRNEPEINPTLQRLLGASRARGDRIEREIAALEGTPPNEFSEQIDTAVKRLEGAAKAVVDAAREKMPSSPGNINVTVEMPRHSRDSSSPPSVGVEIGSPLIGHLKARGMRAVLAVLAVGLLLALAWMAGSRRPATPPAPAVAPAHS